MYHSGRSQLRGGQYSKAATSLSRARQEASSDSWVWFYTTYWLGEAHRLAGEWRPSHTDGHN